MSEGSPAPLVTLITGCSSGIGLQLAVKLAEDPKIPYLVYATMRNLAKQDELVKAAGSALNVKLFIKKLDVTKDDGCKAVCKEIVDKHGRIDILVNNAGAGYIGPLDTMSMETVTGLFDSNFFGTVRMTMEVMPVMKARRSGRIVNISSLVGHYGMAFAAIYNSTKFAMEGFTESMYPVLKVFGVHMSTVQPGPTATSFMANQQGQKNPMEPEEQADAVLDETVKTMKGYFGKLFELFKATDAVQETGPVVDVIVECLQAESPKMRYPTSKAVQHMLMKKYSDPDNLGSRLAEDCYGAVSAGRSQSG